MPTSANSVVGMCVERNIVMTDWMQYMHTWELFVNQLAYTV